MCGSAVGDRPAPENVVDWASMIGMWSRDPVVAVVWTLTTSGPAAKTPGGASGSADNGGARRSGRR